MNKDKRRLGDRYDGRRLRRTPAFFTVMPHIMKRRSDSIVLFDEVIDIENLENTCEGNERRTICRASPPIICSLRRPFG